MISVRQAVGHPRSRSCFLPGGLISLPIGYPKSPYAFRNQCLLGCVMLGFMKLTNPEEFEKIKKMCYVRTSHVIKNVGGEALDTLIKKICLDCDIPVSGPYEITTVLPVIAEKLKLQIHVISSMDGTTPGVLSFPKGHDLNRPRLYLLCYSADHIVFIDSLKTFFEINRKIICFSCLKFLSTVWKKSEVIKKHRCFKQLSCFNCNGLIETEKTVKVENEITYFCDTHLKMREVGNFSCAKCNLKFETQICYQNHERKCNYGWKCPNCNIFQKVINKNNEEIALTHICGELRKRCKFCYQLKATEHICQIKPQQSHEIWPNLCFIHMKFKYLGSGNCNSCFEIRRNYASKNNLTLPELFKSEMFSKLICEHHKNISENPKPNMICLLREEQRHLFSEYLFYDDDFLMDDQSGNRTFQFPYSDILKPMSDKPFKIKKTAQKVSPTFQKILDKQCNTDRKSAVSKLLLFICKSNFSNYTFITPERNMVILFRYFFTLKKNALKN